MESTTPPTHVLVSYKLKNPELWSMGCIHLMGNQKKFPKCINSASTRNASITNLSHGLNIKPNVRNKIPVFENIRLDKKVEENSGLHFNYVVEL